MAKIHAHMPQTLRMCNCRIPGTFRRRRRRPQLPSNTVPADSNLVVRLDLPHAFLGVGEGEDGEDLEDSHREHNREEEGLEGRRLEGDVRRNVNVAAEEGVELLADEEAKRRNAQAWQHDRA